MMQQMHLSKSILNTGLCVLRMLRKPGLILEEQVTLHLNRNAFDDQLLQNGGDGYVHRFTYPDSEASENKANYDAAVAKLNGGNDDLVSRVFWDK